MMAFIFNPKYVCKCNDKYRFSVCTYIYIFFKDDFLNTCNLKKTNENVMTEGVR